MGIILFPRRSHIAPLPDTTYVDAWWDGEDRNQWIYSAYDYTSPLPANDTSQNWVLWRTRIGGGDGPPSRKDMQRDPATDPWRPTTSYKRKGSTGTYTATLKCSRYWVGYDYNAVSNYAAWTIILLIKHDTSPSPFNSRCLYVQGSGGFVLGLMYDGSAVGYSNQVVWMPQAAVYAPTGIAPYTGNYHCYAITCPGGLPGNAIKLYDRGVLKYTGFANVTAGATTFNTTTYFGTTGTSDLINEALVFRSELSASQVDAWWLYFKDKYGLT